MFFVVMLAAFSWNGLQGCIGRCCCYGRLRLANCKILLHVAVKTFYLAPSNNTVLARISAHAI